MATPYHTTPYYVAELLLTDREVVIFGGGTVARRKIAGLLPCGARVTVIAPELAPELEELVHEGRLNHVAEPFHPRHLERQPVPVLIFAATSAAGLNQEIARQAAQMGLWCNSADLPEASGFLVPAVTRRGPVTVAVSTSGRSPALARLLKERIEAWLEPGWGRLAETFGLMRARVHQEIPAKERPAFWRMTARDAADAGPDGVDEEWVLKKVAYWLEQHRS